MTIWPVIPPLCTAVTIPRHDSEIRIYVYGTDIDFVQFL